MDATHVSPKSRPQRGVGLLESAITVAVLAIVVAIAVPSFGAFIEARRLDAVASQLAADVQLARSEAAARNRPVRVSIQTGAAGSCWIVHTGAGADCRCGADPDRAVCNGGATAIKTVTLADADRLRVEANVDSMLFDPLHGTTTPAGTLRVVDSRGRAVQHVVNAMGRTRSCSPGAALTGWRAC